MRALKWARSLLPLLHVSHQERTPPNELASAAIFVLGCAGLCGMLIWLGPDGFAPGYALFGLGWVVAMEVEDRRGRPRALSIRARPAPRDPQEAARPSAAREEEEGLGSGSPGVQRRGEA